MYKTLDIQLLPTRRSDMKTCTPETSNVTRGQGPSVTLLVKGVQILRHNVVCAISVISYTETN